MSMMDYHPASENYLIYQRVNTIRNCPKFDLISSGETSATHQAASIGLCLANGHDRSPDTIAISDLVKYKSGRRLELSSNVIRQHRFSVRKCKRQSSTRHSHGSACEADASLSSPPNSLLLLLKT